MIKIQALKSHIGTALIAIVTQINVLPAAASDTKYPARPITIIQPTAAGGPSDIVIRVIADSLSRNLGQPVIVDNRPGAGGIIGINAVKKEPANGYTLLSSGNFLFTSAALRENPPYDPIKDFTGISVLSTAPMVLVANTKFAPSTVSDLIAYAQKSDVTLQYTSPNFGGVPYLSGQLLAVASGIKLDHVTHKGSPAALIDVIANRVPLMFDMWSSVKPYVEKNQLKVLAVVTGSPIKEAPQYPLLKQTFPVFDFELNNVLLATAGTPASILKRLTEATHTAMNSSEVRSRLQSLGLTPTTSTPDQYNENALREYKKWRDLADTNNIRIN